MAGTTCFISTQTFTSKVKAKDQEVGPDTINDIFE